MGQFKDIRGYTNYAGLEGWTLAGLRRVYADGV